MSEIQNIDYECTITIRRPPVTVEIARGGDYALADYRRQAGRFARLAHRIREARALAERYLHVYAEAIWEAHDET